jgi:hypothetical protein
MGPRRVPASALAIAAQALLVALPLWAAANPIRISPGPLSQRHAAQPALTQRAYRQLIVNQPSDGVQFAFLMTDGSVLAQGGAGNDWYKYVPDINGNYADGTWTQVATMPKGYAPSAFSSAVLADGRLAVSGGEYNTPGNYQLQLTNLGAIYDPVKNTWTKLGHPRGWGFIGDSPNSVLPNGNFLVGQKLTLQAAYLSPTTLKWTKVPTKGKSDFNSEEGWTLLPNGTILTEDVKNAPNSEIYNPMAGKWVSGGSTIVDLHSPSPYHQCLQYGPKPKDCYLPPGEIGPAILRPDGTVFATGSGSGPSGGGTGHTSIYHTTGSLAGKWTQGPDFPNGDDAGDSFACLLPSGNVLVQGVTGALYEFNGTTFTQTGESDGSLLVLPNGTVLTIGFSMAIYTPAGSPQASWAPTISSVPTTLTRGSTYQVTGTQFNGLSQAEAFGDEYQNATNYPLVRIVNNKTKHVFYARTHGHSTMAVATGSTPVSTNFDVPAAAETGASTLVVVANGIASAPAAVTLK